MKIQHDFFPYNFSGFHLAGNFPVSFSVHGSECRTALKPAPARFGQPTHRKADKRAGRPCHARRYRQIDGNGGDGCSVPLGADNCPRRRICGVHILRGCRFRRGADSAGCRLDGFPAMLTCRLDGNPQPPTYGKPWRGKPHDGFQHSRAGVNLESSAAPAGFPRSGFPTSGKPACG